jgi:hypothetical protein
MQTFSSEQRRGVMRSTLPDIQQLLWAGACLLLLAVPAAAQSDGELNLKGAIDFHAHQAPDSVGRTMDADDEARAAKAAGMRGIVMKNHYEQTSSLAYLVRKIVPGIEIFGGITSDLANGGVNLEAVKHMVDTTGGYGRVIWLPTFDSETPEKVAHGIPSVPVSKDGKLLPNVLALIDYISQHPQLVLESGHVSPAEGLLMVHEAHARGVRHIVITHAMASGWSVAQMQEGARDGAYMEFVYSATLDEHSRLTMAGYAAAIKAVGPEHCIMATDLGALHPNSPAPYPLEVPGFLDFMVQMHKAGISVADIDLMSKTNPALALGLTP